jgi:hypothetical protein
MRIAAASLFRFQAQIVALEKNDKCKIGNNLGRIIKRSVYHASFLCIIDNAIAS